jgi:cellulose synthase/poly-beta-1,6-N-acetylglucosamine synthase-like glycosyltransferase
MKALVSILIPACNADEWVGSAIGSALGQTWRQKEILVVDDSSADGTLAVARQFESNEVRVVTQPNQGAVAARVPSAGDTANPDELKDDPENTNTWKSGRSYSSRRNGATLRHQAKNPAGLTRAIRTYFRR